MVYNYSTITTSFRSIKTASLRPKGEVPRKYAVTSYNSLGDFSIVPHFEVTSMDMSCCAFVTRTSAALESGRTSMAINFIGDLASVELIKNSSDHYNSWSFSPSFATRADEMDVYNVLITIPFISRNLTNGQFGNALKTQSSGVFVTKEDYKKTRTSLVLESGRTSMAINFTGDLASVELIKNSSDHYNPQRGSAVQSTKTASLRPKGEVPQKNPTTRYKPIGDFSIVPHFEVTTINENLK